MALCLNSDLGYYSDEDEYMGNAFFVESPRIMDINNFDNESYNENITNILSKNALKKWGQNYFYYEHIINIQMRWKKFKRNIGNTLQNIWDHYKFSDSTIAIGDNIASSTTKLKKISSFITKNYKNINDGSCIMLICCSIVHISLLKSNENVCKLFIFYFYYTYKIFFLYFII